MTAPVTAPERGREGVATTGVVVTIARVGVNAYAVTFRGSQAQATEDEVRQLFPDLPAIQIGQETTAQWRNS